MNELRFDGKVAVVTGAGRGIGRAYALLLAARGAAVVVNDLGGSVEGAGADEGPAGSVVADIVAAGGTAAADTSDISTSEGAGALVAAAVERFDRIDAVVNNAGIMRWGGMPEVTEADFAAHLDVHLSGSFNTIRAAWPHFAAQGYGRIVNTTSAGVFGLPQNLAYAAAKGGVIGLTRSIAVAGRKQGIKANCIAPAAFTRMAGSPTPQINEDAMAPDLVAPMAAFLAHEDCPVSGEVYFAGAGRFSRMFIAATEGYLHTDGEPSIENVAAQWAAINDESRSYVPANLMAWSAEFMRHLPPG